MTRGQITVEPDDGLTTRGRRNRPLLIVNTGEGKGKTSAAMGMAMRSWAQGWSVGIYQFVKSASWRTGEYVALTRLGNSTATSPSSGWAPAAPGCGRPTVAR